MGGPGIAIIIVRVDEFGIDNASEFTFIVSVFNQGDTGADPIATRMISPDRMDSPVVAITVHELPQGTLVFTVDSNNLYGSPTVAFTNNISEPVVVQAS